MTVTVTWQDMLLRLAAALIAGGLIGYDRGTRGRIAGLRTTILICLAATAAMIEANLMLGVSGRGVTSFTTMDALRFPLGILSGIGFIGAGAIVRRGSLVTGVTTAATLWLVTVVGLILGAGYLLFGGALTLLAFVVLSVLKRVEPRLYREHRGHLCVRSAQSGPSEDALRAIIKKNDYRISSLAVTYQGERCFECHLEWYSRESQDHVPGLVKEISGQDGVISVRWEPVSAGHLFE